MAKTVGLDMCFFDQLVGRTFDKLYIRTTEKGEQLFITFTDSTDSLLIKPEPFNTFSVSWHNTEGKIITMQKKY